MLFVPPRAALLCVGGLLFLLGCFPQEAPPLLEVVDWPGRGGLEVPLDQPLRIQFSAPLIASLRDSAWSIQSSNGAPAMDIHSETAGSFFTLYPSLAKSSQLADGSLLPDSHYTLRIEGLPSLDAPSSARGGSLSNYFEVSFQTPSIDSISLFSGLGAFPPRPLVNPSEPLIAPDGSLSLPFRGGFDPRTTSATAIWRSAHSEDEVEVAVLLLENELTSAVLQIQLPSSNGWGVLLLPETLTGLDGRHLQASFRQFRVKVSSNS